jgi:uncharacterized protein YkwD
MRDPAVRPRPRIHHLLAVVLAMATSFTAPIVARSPAAAAPAVEVAIRPEALSREAIYRSRAYIHGLTNNERTSRGLPALAFSAALTNGCQVHANDMAAMRRLTHTGSDGSNGGVRARRYGFAWVAWGENIASGFTSSQSLVAAWMNSSGHRANILNRSFTHMGIGMQRGTNNVNYFCMLLAR